MAYKDILRHTTLIGSALDCPIRLLSEEITPAHCVITLDNEVIRVRALRPEAGIRVNGHPVDISVICHGDCLEIGPFKFRVETNLTFELSKTAPVAETRMDLVQSMGPDTATESAATNDTGPEAAPSAPAEPATEKEKPITLEFLKSLMLQGVLTRFQTQWLLEGKFDDLMIDDYRIIDVLGTGGMGWLHVGVSEKTGERRRSKSSPATWKTTT